MARMLQQAFITVSAHTSDTNNLKQQQENQQVWWLNRL